MIADQYLFLTFLKLKALLSPPEITEVFIISVFKLKIIPGNDYC